MTQPVALVTGASSGIGEATARRLAELGYTVYAAARRVARMDALREKGIQTASLDVTDDASMVALTEKIIAETGRIDVLVNNAGYGSYGALEDVPIAEARRQFDVNVFGSVLCTRYCRPSMVARGGGVVLNQSSNSSYLGVGAYSISKAALNAVTLSLAQELAGDGIRVLGIAPGMVASDAVLARLDQPLKDMVLAGQLVKRFGSIDDLVGMVLLLCSDDALFMTGQTVVVDGGYVRQL